MSKDKFPIINQLKRCKSCRGRKQVMTWIKKIDGVPTLLDEMVPEGYCCTFQDNARFKYPVLSGPCPFFQSRFQEVPSSQIKNKVILHKKEVPDERNLTD